MLEKAEEIAKELARLNSVSYKHLPNSSRFKMISANGVKWSERSTKLGNVHYYEDYLYLAFDFPNGEITESYVYERVDLPLKKPGEKKSGFYVNDKEEDQFGTVRISLYQDLLSDFDLSNSLLINFIAKIFSKSMN